MNTRASLRGINQGRSCSLISAALCATVWVRMFVQRGRGTPRNDGVSVRWCKWVWVCMCLCVRVCVCARKYFFYRQFRESWCTCRCHPICQQPLPYPLTSHITHLMIVTRQFRIIVTCDNIIYVWEINHSHALMMMKSLFLYSVLTAKHIYCSNHDMFHVHLPLTVAWLDCFHHDYLFLPQVLLHDHFCDAIMHPYQKSCLWHVKELALESTVQHVFVYKYGFFFKRKLVLNVFDSSRTFPTFTGMDSRPRLCSALCVRLCSTNGNRSRGEKFAHHIFCHDLAPLTNVLGEMGSTIWHWASISISHWSLQTNVCQCLKTDVRSDVSRRPISRKQWDHGDFRVFDADYGSLETLTDAYRPLTVSNILWQALTEH